MPLFTSYKMPEGGVASWALRAQLISYDAALYRRGLAASDLKSFLECLPYETNRAALRR